MSPRTVSLVVSTALLASIASGCGRVNGQPCSDDEECASGLVCVKSKTVTDEGCVDGAAGFCLAPCTRDVDCEHLYEGARCYVPGPTCGSTNEGPTYCSVNGPW